MTPLRYQFSAAGFKVTEGTPSATITVTRSGNNVEAMSVDYSTSDGTATQNTDYTIAAGTLKFAPGETSKSFTVLLTDDAYVEGNETVNLL